MEENEPEFRPEWVNGVHRSQLGASAAPAADRRKAHVVLLCIGAVAVGVSVVIAPGWIVITSLDDAGFGLGFLALALRYAGGVMLFVHAGHIIADHMRHPYGVEVAGYALAIMYGCLGVFELIPALFALMIYAAFAGG